MFISAAAIAIAVQSAPVPAAETDIQWVQPIRYRREGHPPPCGDGWDQDSRDNLCYRNGTVPPQFQTGLYYPLKSGKGPMPVPCGPGADLDRRDGFCYPPGIVPRRFQARRD
ncbi:hypothetical protein [Bradyrhizobium lablabi]|uniref:hypothetical protein n=1 Tax=Bradyrhizobium lablabi TaxID=722472 RepID=UPI001BA657D4|nr:hypothetical protein [Bradyrhizobium lablabi]MBR0693108.1 hypothetical protein [Bradyrhizobium lablabi]